MKDNIPIDLMIDMMKAAAAAGTLEVEDEGETIRVKGMFSINAKKIKI